MLRKESGIASSLRRAAIAPGILGQIDRPHGGFKSIEYMQLASHILAKARNDPDRLHRGEASHHAAHRAQHANLAAIIAIIGIMRITDETAIARRIFPPASEGTDLPVKLAYGGADKRDLRGQT